MFATPAFAQTVGAAAAGGGPSPFVLPLMMIVGLAAYYFFMIRPQTQRDKQHRANIAAVKRNDTVVLSSGLIGKVTRVEDEEIMVEIATGVNVRVVKAMVAQVRVKGEPSPANNSKAA